jgi:hypothetical protein
MFWLVLLRTGIAADLLYHLSSQTNKNSYLERSFQNDYIFAERLFQK